MTNHRRAMPLRARLPQPALAILAALLLAGCSMHGGQGGPHHYANRGTRPYTVNGVTYYPLASAAGYDKTGTASWYGPGFHGRATASGERFDQNGMTAAHTILPFGTRLLVRNLDNGKSAEVVVNDRGPFVSGRIIDLSKGAAKKLGVLGPGTARVRLTALDGGAARTSPGGGPAAGTAGPAAAARPLPLPAVQQKAPAPCGEAGAGAMNTGRNERDAQSGGLRLTYLQTGCFAGRANAEAQAAELLRSGFDCRIMTNGRGGNLVQAGPWLSPGEAESALRILRTRYGQVLRVTE